MNNQIVNVTDASFVTEIEESDLPVFVDFWAPWCGPCKALVPVLDELAKMYEGRIKFAKIDADQNPDLAKRFQVRGLPTLLLLRKGDLVTRANAGTRTRLVALLDQYVAKTTPSCVLVSSKKKYRAFHGDASIRDNAVARLAKHIDASEVVSSPQPLYDEAARRYSIIGATIHSENMAQYEAELGIPESVARLHEQIDSNFIRTTAGADGQHVEMFAPDSRDRPIRWLNDIPLGADLQNVSAHFLGWLLRDLLASENVLTCGASAAAQSVLLAVAELHARSARGDTPSAAEWEDARKIAMASVALEDDVASSTIIAIAETTAWPADESADAAGSAIGSLFNIHAFAAIRAGYTPEDWDALGAANEAFGKIVDDPDSTPESLLASPERSALVALVEKNSAADNANRLDAQLLLADRLHAGLVRCLTAAVIGEETTK
jgi:thioredoxin 1